MIGELLAVACRDRDVLARLGGRIGEAAREAADEYDTLAPDERRRTRARILAAARTPAPPGIRGIHPTWIEAGLVGLPARARTALANGDAAPADIWLVRWACAELPPLPAIEPALRSPRSIDDAIRLSGDTLIEWLVAVGTDQLAHALRSAGPSTLAAIAKTVPTLTAASIRIERPPRFGALGPARAAIARCRDASVGRTEGLLAIGARALAPHTDTLARRQLAVRLPRPLGLMLRDELERHGSTSTDQVPTWSALGAK